MSPKAKKAFLALLIFSWTAREADKLYCHQTPKHLSAGVVEISTPAMFSFSWSLYCRPILTTSSLDALSFKLAVPSARMRSEGYSTSFVCLSVTTSLAHLAAKSLMFGHR